MGQRSQNNLTVSGKVKRVHHIIQIFQSNPREFKTYSCKGKYADDHSRFICNSQKLETSHCPSQDERINKLWYRHTMEYYLAK